MSHPEPEQLLGYLAQDVSEQDAWTIGGHLRDCEVCLTRLRALESLRQEFESHFGPWTAVEHGVRLRSLALAGALEHAAVGKPGLSARLRSWLSRLAEEPGLAFRVLLDRTRRLATAAGESLPGKFDLRPRPAVPGVAGAGPGEDVSRRLERSRDLLRHGHDEEAVGELLEAVRIDAGAAQDAVLEVRRGGERVLSLEASGRRGRIVLRFWPRRRSGPFPVALLVPRDLRGAPAVAPFTPVEGEAWASAEFAEVPDGTHAIFLDPTGAE